MVKSRKYISLNLWSNLESFVVVYANVGFSGSLLRYSWILAAQWSMSNGFSDWTDHSDEEAASMWRKHMGDTARWHGFPVEMPDLLLYG